MRPPKIVKPYVISFCRAIVPIPEPRYVRLEPKPNAPQNECFSIVPEHVRKHGGEMIVGWSIWEWPKVLIEAEFHAVWRQADGTLLDISPKIVPMPRVLFLPDPKRRYDGRQVNNIRKPLDRDPAIKRLCDLCNQLHEEKNRGELAEYHGPIQYTPKMLKLEMERERTIALLQQRYGATLPEPVGAQEGQAAIGM